MNDAEVTLYSTLGVETNEIDHIAGKTVMNNHKVVYDVQDEKGEYFITFTIDGSTLELWVDFATETLVQKANNVVLTANQKATLLSFSDRFSEALVTSNGNTPSQYEIGRMEFAFVKAVEYWSQAPQGYVYDNKHFTANVDIKSLGDDMMCLSVGTYYSLVYDQGDGGRAYSATRRAGYDGTRSDRPNYDCMGRCGVDCGRSWIPSAWALDCFEHDECGLRFGSSGGSSDADCGDEFDEAFDDWLFGVARGCNGR